MNKSLIAGTIAIGLVASLWQILSSLYASSSLGSQFPLTGLAVSGFFGWTTFYAIGGKKSFFFKGISTNLSGIFWGIAFVLLMLLFPKTGLGLYIGLAIAGFISAGMMVFQAHIKIFSFVPAAFIGCTTFFAVGGSITVPVIATAVIGLILGNLLGVLSSEFSVILEKDKIKK